MVSHLEGGHDGVFSILLFAGAEAVQGDGAGGLELRGGDEGNAHGKRQGANSQDDGDLHGIWASAT